MKRGEHRLRVLVADDHPLFRDGMERAVRSRPDFEFVGAAAGGCDTLAQVRKVKPDVAVVDLRMPGIDGLRALRAIAGEASGTRVLILSASIDPPLVYEALQAGAGGYFCKDADRDAICDAIAAVGRGEVALDPSLHVGVLREIALRGRDGSRPLLTPREREVLGLISEGLTAPAIAERLVLAVPTVKTHIARLYEKLGVSDRAAAVAEAMRRGLVV